VAAGLDLGSSYVKRVVIDEGGEPIMMDSAPTGYDYQAASAPLLEGLPGAIPLGVTGYGRRMVPGSVSRTEVTCLARALRQAGHMQGTLVDIGGQDCKVLRIENGALKEHRLNRRCAAGTGSYLEFLSQRLQLKPGEMNEMALSTDRTHRISSFCTVFTSTEILDCLRKGVPLPDLIRGLYASISERVEEMARLTPPVFLSGGTAAHHPALKSVMEERIGEEVVILVHSQFCAALGAALIAREVID